MQFPAGEGGAGRFEPAFHVEREPLWHFEKPGREAVLPARQTNPEVRRQWPRPRPSPGTTQAKSMHLAPRDPWQPHCHAASNYQGGAASGFPVRKRL